MSLPSDTYSEDFTTSTILLDPAIRNWVLIPITLVTLVSCLVRSFFGVLQRPSNATPGDLSSRQEHSIIDSSTALRSGASLLPASHFESRRKHFVTQVLDITKTGATGTGFLSNMNTTAALSMDRSAMLGPIKERSLAMLPNAILVSWVTALFRSVICANMPFSLTPRWRGMLQNGAEAAGLDFSYVSAVCWYIVAMMGLPGLASLLAKDPIPDPVAGMAAMNGAAMVPPSTKDMPTRFRGEKDRLLVASRDEEVFAGVERRLLTLEE